MKTTLIIALTIVLSSLGSIAQMPPDSCLKMFCPNTYDLTNNPHGDYNPDSVMVDSCLGSPTYGKLFAKFRFTMAFEECETLGYPFDTVPGYGSIVNLNSLRASYDSVKIRYQNLDSDFDFMIYKPGGIPGEGKQEPNEHLQRPHFYIVFNRKVPVEEAVQKLRELFDGFGSVQNYYMRAGKNFTSINENLAFEKVKIFPNPSYESIYIEGGVNNQEYEIANSLGQVLIKGNYVGKIDISALKKGIYFISIGMYKLQFIKE